MAVTLLVLAGCTSAPRRDGPPAGGGSAVSGLPDAVPRVEPIRVGGPNKPYTVLGRSYTPMTADLPLYEEGLASWYGTKFHGARTASGEPYDMNAMTAAHRTMPLPSYARVRNPANGREVIVRVNDRGPFVDGRVIDLSYAAAVKLGVQNGVAPVEVRRLTFDEIRAGTWSGGGTALAAVAPAPAVAAPTPVVRSAAVVPEVPVPAPNPARAGRTPRRGLHPRLRARRPGRRLLGAARGLQPQRWGRQLPPEGGRRAVLAVAAAGRLCRERGAPPAGRALCLAPAGQRGRPAGA
jgi:rare lipoprotein A